MEVLVFALFQAVAIFFARVRLILVGRVLCRVCACGAHRWFAFGRLFGVYVRHVFWGCGSSVHSCRPRGLQSYLAKAFLLCGSALVSVFHFGLVFVVC